MPLLFNKFFVGVCVYVCVSVCVSNLEQLRQQVVELQATADRLSTTVIRVLPQTSQTT